MCCSKYVSIFKRKCFDFDFVHIMERTVMCVLYISPNMIWVLCDDVYGVHVMCVLHDYDIFGVTMVGVTVMCHICGVNVMYVWCIVVPIMECNWWCACYTCPQIWYECCVWWHVRCVRDVCLVWLWYFRCDYGMCDGDVPYMWCKCDMCVAWL